VQYQTIDNREYCTCCSPHHLSGSKCATFGIGICSYALISFNSLSVNGTSTLEPLTVVELLTGCCLQNATRRPASTDRTARRQFQAIGQPVSRTQASDVMTSRLPRYEAKCVQRRCFHFSNGGRSLCFQISRERSYPLSIY